jgi:hypothetical protein
VYAGFQAGQERRTVLQPTEPVAGSQGFDVESAAARDRREFLSLPRETPRRSSRPEGATAAAPEGSETNPAEAGSPGGSAEDEPLLSAEVPGVTTVEVGGTDPLSDAGSLLDLDEAETLLP